MKQYRKKLSCFDIVATNLVEKIENMSYTKKTGYHYFTRGADMKISYKKLWLLLIEKEISKVELRRNLNIASGTMTKLNKNEEVSLSVLLRICGYLNCDIGDICEAVAANND